MAASPHEPIVAEGVGTTEEWRVEVRLLNGELVAQLRVRPGSMVAQLREEIAAAAGSKGHLRLVHRGATLLDELSLADAGLGDDAVVTAVRVAGLRVACKNLRCCLNAVCVWNLDWTTPLSGRPLVSLQLTGRAVQSIAISPDGARVAIGSMESYPGEEDATLSLWCVETGVCEKVWEHTAERDLCCVAFSPDGKTLAWGSGCRLFASASLWDLGAERFLGKLQGHEDVLYALAFGAGGRFATGARDLTAKVWNLESLECSGTFTQHADTVHCICFSPDGATVASASEDGEALLWSPEDCQLLARLRGHHDQVCGVGFSPDGRLLVTGSSDRTAKVWEVSSGLCQQTLHCGEEDVRFAAFWPNGGTVITGSDETVKVWNVEKGVCERAFAGECPCGGAMRPRNGSWPPS